jgi:hypothetical protein
MPIDPRTSIYYECQSGGLCRLHSLNAFFGECKISRKKFREYMIEYDKYLKERYNITTSCAKFDLMNSDQTNLVAYVLRQYKVYMRYYPLNSIWNKPINECVRNANFIFVYNEGHIWGIRKKNGRYYKVDSLNGVHPFNINSLRSQKNIGLMVPISPKKEWDIQTSIIGRILKSNDITCKKDLRTLLTKYHSEKKILGELEIPLGICMSILEMNVSETTDPDFKQIRELVDLYNDFISKFTKGNYRNLSLILKYVPNIIFVGFKNFE